MPLLVVSAFLDYLAILLAFLSAGSLAFISFRLFIQPALKIRTRKGRPPSPGHSEAIIFKVHENVRIFSIGQLFGDLNLRLKGIREKHLVIKLHREPGQEIYDLFIEASGIVYMRAPHTRQFERLKGKANFSNAELIGHTASFRLTAKLLDGRPLHYVEMELACEYFVNRGGLEQMKFILNILEVKPPVDLNSRNKKGIYAFKSADLGLRRSKEEEEDLEDKEELEA